MEECIATVTLVTLQGKMNQTVRETQVVLSRRLIDTLPRVAKARDCSVGEQRVGGLVLERTDEEAQNSLEANTTVSPSDLRQK
jgi:hypothetical protein